FASRRERETMNLRARVSVAHDHFEQVHYDEQGDHGGQKEPAQPPGLSAAAPREQGVQLGLITRFRRLLQAELIAALGIIAGLLFGEITGIGFAGRARGNQDIKVKGVAEGETGWPKLAA